MRAGESRPVTLSEPLADGREASGVGRAGPKERVLWPVLDIPWTHPVLGHRVRFVQTPEETQGELLQIEYIVRRPETPFQHIPLHVHQTTEERFEVVRGTLGVILGDKTNRQVLDPGQDILIPSGTPHSFWNACAGELCFLTDIRPPQNFQTYWETMFGE